MHFTSCNYCGGSASFKLIHSDGTEMEGCRGCWDAFLDRNMELGCTNPVELARITAHTHDHTKQDRVIEVWQLDVAMKGVTMKIFDDSHTVPDRYRSDSERIQRVAAAHGVVMTVGSAHGLWDRYSDMSAAGWLNLPGSDEDLWHAISSQMTYEEDWCHNDRA